MTHTSTQTILPSLGSSTAFLPSLSPSQIASPSVAQYSAGLAHDARNMLAAMDIYCELLGSPGVLKPKDRHLLDDLRLLRDSSGKLLDRLLIDALKCLSTEQVHSTQAHLVPQDHFLSGGGAVATEPQRPIPVVSRHSKQLLPLLSDLNSTAEDVREDRRTRAAGPVQCSTEASRHVNDLATELQSSLPMLAALAGPRVHLSLDTSSCPKGELFIPPVDLTRVLINLVRNAAEAMSIGGRIVIAAAASVDKGSRTVMISIEDNGPGIPLSLLDRIFDLQASIASTEESSRPRMQFRPRGLGLRIVREFVEASGGTVRALRLHDRGSRFEILLPMVTLQVTKDGATL